MLKWLGSAARGRNWGSSGLYMVCYAGLVGARFQRGIAQNDADTISRASLEAANLLALMFAVGAEFGAKMQGGMRYTFGNRRIHVLCALMMCVVVMVDSVLNLMEVLDDFSWIPDKDTLWEKKEINALQVVVGLTGIGVLRSVTKARVKRPEHCNRHGVYLHALATCLDALITLIVSFTVPNQQGRALLLNVVGTFGVGVVIALCGLPLLRTTLYILLHRTPPEAAGALNKRVLQLATFPGVRDCTDVHFWTDTSGIYICTMRVRLGPFGDNQAVLAAAFELFDDFLDDLTVQIDQDPL